MKFTTTRYIPIPENATNGDIIKAMFPNANIWLEDEKCVSVDFDDICLLITFPFRWWNAPYKKGDK